MRTPRRVVSWSLLLLLCGCSAASELLYQPAPDDPNDGYEGSLAQAGVTTEMDWGPKQDLLLSQFQTLKEEHGKLQRRVDQLVAENHNLLGQLTAETESLHKEQGARRQSDALVDNLQKKTRELEARILSLSIEKAKLEQAALLAKIAEMQRAIDAGSTTTEAAMPPAGK